MKLYPSFDAQPLPPTPASRIRLRTRALLRSRLIRLWIYLLFKHIANCNITFHSGCVNIPFLCLQSGMTCDYVSFR